LKQQICRCQKLYTLARTLNLTTVHRGHFGSPWPGPQTRVLLI
jgi:hypothetical protein